MPQNAAYEFGTDRRSVHVENLVKRVDCGVHGFAVDRWDCGVFEALDEIIDGGGRHGMWGGKN